MSLANVVGSPAGAVPGGGMIGPYRVLHRLGAGREGQAFAVVDTRVGDQRRLALKVFSFASPAIDRRVRLEFERLAALDHPSVVRVVDVGRHEGRPFLVTEIVAGPSLLEIARLADEGDRRTRLHEVAVGLADALGYLHGRGVVHGDVSPGNVQLGDDGIPVLLDVGGAVLATPGAAFGTLGFAAPEALVGEVSAATDLFGLGACLFAAWTGAGPFGQGAESVPRLLAGPAPRLSAARPGLGADWDDLVAALLRPSPNDRPSSARQVLRQLKRLGPAKGTDPPGSISDELLPPHPGGDVLGGVFVGRERERAVLADALRGLSRGEAPFSVITLVGPEGAGRRSLIDQALRDQAVDQLSATPARRLVVFRGSVAALGRWMVTADRPFEDPASPVDPDHERHNRFARIVADLERSAAERPLCIVLEGELGDGGTRGAEADLAAFVAGAPPSGRLLFVLAASRALARVAALDLELGPLTVADVATLIARAVGEPQPGALVARVFEASGGHAATACHVTRQLVVAVRHGVAERFTPEHDVELRHRLTGLFGGQGHAARRALVCVALGMEPPEAGGWDAAGPSAGLDDARASGWLVARPEAGPAGSTGPGFHLPGAAHEAAVAEALADPDVRDLTAIAAERLPDEDGRRGICLAALGRAREAVAAFRRAAASVRAAAARDQQIDVGEDCRWLARAFRLGPNDLTVDERVRLGNRLALEGRAADAEEVLTLPAAPPGASPATAELRLDERRAWLRARAGDLEGARTLLEDALARSGDAPESVRAPARARLARVLFGLQRFPQAVAMARTALADPVAGPLAIETSLLAHAYGGDLPAARRLLEALPAPARTSPRSLVLVALVDHLGGELERALDGYRRALAEADRAGDIHTAAAIALNLGALSAESGRYAEALTVQDRAVRELGRIGATAELATALFNAGMLLCELGDLVGARRLAERLRSELALRSGTTSCSAAYLDAEIAAREGDEATALVGLNALAARELDAPPHLRRAAVLAAADLLGRTGLADEAAFLLDTLLAPSPAPGAPAAAPDGDPALRLARARVLLATEVWDADAAARLGEELVADATRAATAGRRPAAFRTGLAAARLFHRLGRPREAVRSLTSARRSFEEVYMSTPTDHQPGLKKDPDARILAELAELTRLEGGGDAGDGAVGAGGAREAGARAERSEGRLRRLLRINKRLNSELRLPRLLELIMDTVIELTDAERGFLLLEDDDGELIVKVARNIDQQSLDTGGLELSRSIASQAARGGAPIVTIDAAGDPRFRSALSVSDLHLRSVLAVPLQIKGRAAGTVYVDHRLRQGAFSDEDVQLVLDFTEQAAIAIENARLMSELRKRERKIEVLNQRLQGELDVRKEELSGMKQELRENREALAIRYDYRNIVGRTPRMMEMFHLLDRLTDTALPVVIQGESGTGKELVARALHFNGPRRAEAFVSENCAAIPETLLESTLFGAVRGAFTGADHDSRGLFEVADGGTLFLDEVAEMSPGMQGKLLRILQTGELRRVGGERTRKVDVRIVAASNRDLGRMVEEGKFRQDLFFRLSVARILLPPLRERREDIPAIVAHLLGKIATTTTTTAGGRAGKPPGASPQPKRLEPQALARLCAYRWPGNVRELENELMRAVALSGDVIGVDDLSVHVAGAEEAALTAVDDPDNLALKPRVERLERALLREALSRHGGNQTKAADALGLSRFGLQKKLRRYGFS